jgi:hypothetical protein
MATYTLAQVSFTAAQEAGLDRKLFIHNQGRANSSPPLPAQTKQQYLDGLAQEWPKQFVAEFRDDFKDRCSLVIQTASVATLQSVATTLAVDINPYD